MKNQYSETRSILLGYRRLIQLLIHPLCSLGMFIYRYQCGETGGKKIKVGIAVDMAHA